MADAGKRGDIRRRPDRKIVRGNMLSMLPGYRSAALVIAAGGAATLPVFAQTAVAPPPSASAAAAGDATPSERAKRDAEKVFHWILIQGDRTRKTNAAAAPVKDPKDERPAAAPKVIATRSGTVPARAAAADPVPEVVLHPKSDTVTTASAPVAPTGATAPVKLAEPAAAQP
ncbi:MAG TPA: hypothetical protein VIO33_00295, partial [Burkholderiaceae bacterium]